jgi:hypothetical protein
MLVKRGTKTATVPFLQPYPTAVPLAILRGSARDVRDASRAEKVIPVTGNASLAAPALSAGDANVSVEESTLTVLLLVLSLNLVKIPWHLLVLLRKDVPLAIPRASVLDAGGVLTAAITIIVTASAPCAMDA